MGLRPLQPLLYLPHSRWVTVRPVRGHLTPKVNITFFYQKLDAEFFFIQLFFEKKQYFLKKPWKTALGRIWQFFREMRRLAPKINITFFLSQMRYWIFYHFSFFKKSYNFLRKQQKPFFWSKSLLKGRRRLATKKNVTSFMRNEVFNIFSFNNFFEKSNIFVKNGEKNVGGTWPFF